VPQFFFSRKEHSGPVQGQVRESGHFAAMKVLGYRDMKMFFIPFLGAAGTGTAKSNSATKSCFVSIMGPLPIMPLDGGRYIDVLFVRNVYFHFAFSLFGVGCFAALAIADGDFFMGLIAFLSLAGAIAELKSNRVARKMIRHGMTESTLSELEGNPEAFNKLITVQGRNHGYRRNLLLHHGTSRFPDPVPERRSQGHSGKG
jgi:hypothetical protein